MTLDQVLDGYLWTPGVEGKVLSDDARDPGRLTKWGATDREWRPYARHRGWGDRSVATATDPELREFYRDGYWLAVRADALPWPVNVVAFDAAVNQGAGYAARLVQFEVGVTQDGVIGPVTMAAVRRCPPHWLASEYVWDRLGRYRATVRKWKAERHPDPLWAWDGWMNRLDRLRRFAGLEQLAAPRLAA